jgi:hypothetical protein
MFTKDETVHCRYFHSQALAESTWSEGDSFCKQISSKHIVTILVIIDGVWIGKRIYWTVTTRYYILHFSLTHILMPTVTSSLSLLGSGFNSRCSLSSGPRTAPVPQLPAHKDWTAVVLQLLKNWLTPLRVRVRARHSYFKTGGLPPISWSWRQAPSLLWILNCCRSSTAQWFLVPRPMGSMTIIFVARPHMCLELESPPQPGEESVFLSRATFVSLWFRTTVPAITQSVHVRALKLMQTIRALSLWYNE